MDSTTRIVTSIPLTELWNSGGPLDARRAHNIGDADIARLLRDGSSFVVADVGLPLRLISAEDRFAFWKAEVRSRLIAPDADSFQLDDYPDNYCYVAAMWECSSRMPIIVLERHH
jgi:hypothetical protein